ncbi:ATP-binding protein [Lentisphaera profundi]|uniref:histidine kinase n=1 Tax=Lentisphaera profundi TaxID=1658616 RepID=A0ABY7VT59_9BACT|nr:ATP-binding protein [Lentisphaera profundi]WDE97383.1 ATP-binding protein [Lentisphaera profundi]
MNKLAHVAVCNTTKESFHQINQYLDHSLIHLYHCEDIEELKKLESEHLLSLIIIDHHKNIDHQSFCLEDISQNLKTQNTFIILPKFNPEEIQAYYNLNCSDLIYPPICSEEFSSRVKKLLAQEEINRNLENALQIKSEFAATMSHEIRTPLNGIIGILNILQETNINTRQTELVNIICHSSEALLNLVNNILDFAKLEDHQLTLRPEAFSLFSLCLQVIDLAKTSCNKEKLTLSIDTCQELKELILMGDKNRLRQIISNLVSNAVKFTDQGHIKLQLKLDELKCEHAKITISVSDTGIGISPEENELIFSKFAQVDNSHSRKNEGTGLGIPISEMILQCMNSNLELNSNPGEGSTFSFTISLPVTNKALLKKETSDLHLPALRILIAEDNLVNQRVMHSYLNSDKQHYIKTAENGFEVIEFLKSDHFDLILMDIQMPGMDGLETTKVIRETKAAYQHVPIIAVTANAMEGDRERYLKLGINSYLPKPYSKQLLLKTVSKLIQKSDEVSLLKEPTHAAFELIDSRMLLDIHESLGAEGFHKLIEIYLKEVQGMLKEIKTAALAKDQEQFIRYAHKYAGGAASLGFNTVREISKKMETLTREGHFDLALALHDSLELNHQNTLLTLNDFVFE